jgi:hypothetical protein
MFFASILEKLSDIETFQKSDKENFKKEGVTF